MAEYSYAKSRFDALSNTGFDGIAKDSPNPSMLWLVLLIIALVVIATVAFCIYRNKKNADAQKYVHLAHTEPGAITQGNTYSVNRVESNFSES
jgi:hypothetical protein